MASDGEKQRAFTIYLVFENNLFLSLYLDDKESYKWNQRKDVLTAKPIMATRPTKSSFALVKPMPPDVPNIPSSVFGFGSGAWIKKWEHLNQTPKTNAKLLTKNQPFKSLFSFLKLEKKIKTFLAGALVLDLKRANVLNLGDKEDDEEEEEEVWTGGSKRWVNGFGFSNGSLFKLNEWQVVLDVSNIVWAMASSWFSRNVEEEADEEEEEEKQVPSLFYRLTFAHFPLAF